MTTFRAVILAAVSSKDQLHTPDGEDKDSIPSQISRARTTIESRGWTESAEPLVIPGQSRSLNWLHEAIDAIPAYQQLRDLVDHRLVDLVVVRNYDRLARTATLQTQVSAWLKEHGVQIYALELGVEPHPPATWRPRADSGRIWMEAIAGATSETALNQLVNYKRFGMEGRTRKGQHAEGVAPYGYVDVLDPTGFGHIPKRRIPDPERFLVVQRLFAMVLAGRSMVYVARWLNGDVDNPDQVRAPIPAPRGGFWTSMKLSSLIHNPFYGGKVARYRLRPDQDGRGHQDVRRVPPILVDGLHQAAVTWDEWQRANDLVAERAIFAPRLRRRDHLWSGMAVCGLCLDRGELHAMRHHHSVQVNKGDKRQRVYDYLNCMHYSLSAGKFCEFNGIQLADFVGGVVAYLRRAIDDPAGLLADAPAEADPRDQLRADLARVQESLHRLAGEEARWDSAYRQGAIPLEKYGAGLRDLQTQRQRADLEQITLAQALAHAGVTESRLTRRTEALARLATTTIDTTDPAIVASIHEVLAQVQVRRGALTFVPH